MASAALLAAPSRIMRQSARLRAKRILTLLWRRVTGLMAVGAFLKRIYNVLREHIFISSHVTNLCVVLRCIYYVFVCGASARRLRPLPLLFSATLPSARSFARRTSAG
jgi:hypothetical protein